MRQYLYVSFVFVVSCFFHTGIALASIQVSNQQWYTLRVQCGNEKSATSHKLGLYKHFKCKHSNTMYLWHGGKKPESGATEHLSRLCSYTSRTINLTKHYFKVVSGKNKCNGEVFAMVRMRFGYRFIIQGGKYAASIRGVGPLYF